MQEEDGSTNESESGERERKWRTLGAIERRVLGTLIEKAKTTDTYPITLNALRAGCNQKSNRDPQMDLTADQIEESLEKLRSVNAVAEVQGDGRVSKYRHFGYDWLGVDKYEIAVVTELLLRGAQTVGELRGRAARMEPIADVAALRPILESLIQKELVISLTPAGRGQIVTHNLYLPEQLEKVKQQAISDASASASTGSASTAPRASTAPANTARSSSAPNDEIIALRRELDELKSEVAKMKSEIEDIWSNIGS